MLLRRITVISLILLFASALGACGGGGADVKAVTTTTTMGQELQDLEKAHKDGLISDSQYDKAKRDILDRYK